jgi:hypothetical protein
MAEFPSSAPASAGFELVTDGVNGLLRAALERRARRRARKLIADPQLLERLARTLRR